MVALVWRTQGLCDAFTHFSNSVAAIFIDMDIVVRSGAHLNLLLLVCNRKNGNKVTEVEEILWIYFLS